MVITVLLFNQDSFKMDNCKQFRALGGVIVLCYWAKHSFTLTVPISTQVYEWVLANYNLMVGVTLGWTGISSGGGGEWNTPWLAA